MIKVDGETDSLMLEEALENLVKCFVCFCWTINPFGILTAVREIGQAAFNNVGWGGIEGFIHLWDYTVVVTE